MSAARMHARVGTSAVDAAWHAASAAEHAHEFLPYGTAYLDAERIRAQGDSL